MRQDERLLAIVRELAGELKPGAPELASYGLHHQLERDFGLDSLSRVELFARVERELGVQLGGGTRSPPRPRPSSWRWPAPHWRSGSKARSRPRTRPRLAARSQRRHPAWRRSPTCSTGMSATRAGACISTCWTRRGGTMRSATRACLPRRGRSLPACSRKAPCPAAASR